MSLFDHILGYIKSAGHAVESEEHKLLNEFAVYLGSDKVVSGFSSDPVVKTFVASLVPAPEPVQVAPEPTPEPTPEPIPEPIPEPVVEEDPVVVEPDAPQE